MKVNLMLNPIIPNPKDIVTFEDEGSKFVCFVVQGDGYYALVDLETGDTVTQANNPHGLKNYVTQNYKHVQVIPHNRVTMTITQD